MGIFFAESTPFATPQQVSKVLTSIYFSIVTWTTLGYGDFRPVESMRIVAACEAILGYVYMGVMVGVVINLLAEKRK